MKKFLGLIMNLQLFSYNPYPTTTPANSTTSSDLIPENDKIYYDQNLIDYAQAQLVHEQFAVKKPIPKNHGKTTEFRKYHPLVKATQPLTEGVTPDGKKMVVTAITATIGQFGDFIAMTDMLQLTAIDNNVLQATKLLGRQAGLTMDTVVREAMNAGANVGYASTWSGTTETTHASRYSLDAGAKLTVLEVQKAVRTLRRNNAPTFNDGYYRAIIHPDCAFDLMRDPEWQDWHKYASPEEAYKGEIGRIGGVRFVQSTEAKIFKGDTFLNASSTPPATLTVASAISSATTSISVTPYLPTNSNVGRYILIPTSAGTVRRKITGVTAVSTTGATITVDENVNNVAANAVIYPGEAGAENCAVYSCLFMGEGAYAVTEVEGGGLETIIQPPTDPLHQRSTVGWKGVKTAEILIDEYLYRLEVGSSMSGVATAN